MEKHLLNRFRLVGRDLFTTQLVTSHAGNLSVRVNGEIIITRSGAMLGHLEERDLIHLPLDFSGLHSMASRELPVHLAIYRKTGAWAVVHAHPPYTVTLSLISRNLKPLDAEGLYTLGNVPIVEVQRPIGSEELAFKVSQALRALPIMVVKGHGTFARGDSLEGAYHYTSVLEASARILYLSSR